MIWRVLTACSLAVLLVACGADMTIPYATTLPPTPYNEGQADIPGSTGVPNLPGLSAPTLVISYPVEERTDICLDPGNTVVTYYAAYGAPAGAQVRFVVDRHVGGGIDQGTFAMNSTCTLLDGSSSADVGGGTSLGCARLDFSATATPVGYHLISAEIVDGAGDPLQGIPADNQAHKFQVNFTTRARTVDSSVCPIVCGDDNDCPTGAVCDDGWCVSS